MVDYGPTINEDRDNTSRLLTQCVPRTFDIAESPFSHFRRLTVAKMDERGDTSSEKRKNACHGVSTQTLVQNTVPLTNVFCTVIQ